MYRNIKITIFYSLLLLAVSANAVVADVFDMLWKYNAIENAKEEKQKNISNSIQAIVIANQTCNAVVDKDSKKFDRKAKTILQKITTNKQRIQYAIVALQAKNKFQERRQLCNASAISKLEQLKGK